MNGRVLIVAGSDSGGGAGIQADIKTVTALGGYAATAITALTAQNTLGVFAIVPVEPSFVRQQMDAVLGDIGADCIKTGMLHDEAIIAAVAESLAAVPRVPLVVDPVTVVTPNIPEAEALLGRRIGPGDMHNAAAALAALGAKLVMLKGGHLPGNTVRDVVVEGEESWVLEIPRIDTRHTHGTGCTLASAIATGLAQGMAPRAAIARAHAFVQQAIRTAPGYGQGHGPLNHAHTMVDEP